MHSPQEFFAGIGLRSAHYQPMLEMRPALGWLEVHPENYFCGGAHLRMLERVGELYPLSFHAVGLSLGAAEPVNKEHLRQLKALVDRFQPVRVSDHASWSKSGNAHLGDLLPMPYNDESLDVLCRNIGQVQEYLGRRILIENPSTYLQFTESTMPEPEFMSAAVRRTGCGLLLDVNNIYVQAHNHGLDAESYLAAVPASMVEEIHLAGHKRCALEEGALLVDTHNQLVCDEVWGLFTASVRRFGAVPALIEWDKDIPPLYMLVSEAHKAEAIIMRERLHAAA